MVPQPSGGRSQRRGPSDPKDPLKLLHPLFSTKQRKGGSSSTPRALLHPPASKRPACWVDLDVTLVSLRSQSSEPRPRTRQRSQARPRDRATAEPGGATGASRVTRPPEEPQQLSRTDGATGAERSPETQRSPPPPAEPPTASGNPDSLAEQRSQRSQKGP